MTDIAGRDFNLGGIGTTLTSPPAPTAASPWTRMRVHLLWVALVLAPGILAHLQLPLGSAFGRFEAAMMDIRFGSGFRFWCGVAGTLIMAFLLLYPLRKQLVRGRGLGSVGLWYQTHIVLGLLAPALIAYHCDFGFGALHANAALLSMLVVGASGVAGYLLVSRFKLWRLLHVPVFVITVIATSAHIYSVWGVKPDDEMGPGDMAAAVEQSLPSDTASSADLDAPAALPTAPGIRAAEPAAANENGLLPAGQVASGDLGGGEGGQGPQEDKAALAALAAAAASDNPDQGTSDSVIAPPAPAPAKRLAKLAAAPKPKPKPKADPLPAIDAPMPEAEPASMPAPAPEDPMAKLLRIAKSNAFSEMSLAQVLRDLKAGHFDHSKTRYPLTGAHTRTPCSKCHVDGIKDTPTDCKACHQKDDVHRGRKPNCGRCHSTSRW